MVIPGDKPVRVILKHVSITFPNRPEGATSPDPRVLAAYQYWDRRHDLVYSAAMLSKVPPELSVLEALEPLETLEQYGLFVVHAEQTKSTKTGRTFRKVRVREQGWIQEGMIWIDERRNQYTFSVSCRPEMADSAEFKERIRSFLSTIRWTQ